jgi:hypothetical protein
LEDFRVIISGEVYREESKRKNEEKNNSADAGFDSSFGIYEFM